MRTHDNLTPTVAAELRRLIADGILIAGERINEVRLATELGVSRTPLREALSRLVADGLIESRARRGFFVRPLDPESVRQIYQMRAILDPAALELAGVPVGRTLERLRRLNRELATAVGDVERIIDLDDRWHLELVRRCSNQVLLNLIRDFMQRTRPLERAYVRQHENVDRMMAEHEAILALLDAGELDGAVAALRQNMRSGLDPIIDWLLRSRPGHEEMRR